MDRLRLTVSTFAMAVLCALPADVPAQAGGTFRIDSAVIAGGGATLDGGAFRLSGTVGQPATSPLGGANYVMRDGFWTPAANTSDEIFMNGFDP